MGIKGLKRVISENAPEAIKEGKLDAYFGRKIAIDASMFLYSFLVAIQAGEDTFGLTDANGETTRLIVFPKIIDFIPFTSLTFNQYKSSSRTI